MRISDWSSDVCSSDLFAFVDYAHTISHFLGLFDIMRRQDDGDSTGAKLPHEIPHVAPQLDIHSGGGLIQKQYLRFMRQCLGDQHASLHAPGKFHHLRIALVPKRKIAQQLFAVGGIGPLSEKTPTEVYRTNTFFVNQIGKECVRTVRSRWAPVH